jgi:hypothetical protein
MTFVRLCTEDPDILEGFILPYLQSVSRPTAEQLNNKVHYLPSIDIFKVAMLNRTLHALVRSQIRLAAPMLTDFGRTVALDKAVEMFWGPPEFMHNDCKYLPSVSSSLQLKKAEMEIS